MKILAFFINIILTCIILLPSRVFAVDYTYTTATGLLQDGTPIGTFPAAGLLVNNSNSHSTLQVINGTMAATGGAYTAFFDAEQYGSGDIVTISSGATLSYSGSTDTANTLSLNLGQYDYNVLVQGTLSRGSNATNGYALYIDAGDTNIDVLITGTVNGPILRDNASLSFATGFVVDIDGNSAQFNGALTNVGVRADSSFRIGYNSAAGSFSTGGTVTGVENLLLYATGGPTTANINYAFTGLNTQVLVSANSTLKLNATLAGTAVTNNNGTIYLNVDNPITTSGIFTNNNKLNIAAAFTVPAGFVNTTGELYVIGTGSISGNITAGTILRVGVDSTGAANTCNFTTGGTIAGIEVVSVNNGSLTANHAISGVSTSFDVISGAVATFNAQLSGAGCDTTNAGDLVLNVANAINTTGPSNPFNNTATGKVYVAHTFTPSNYSTFTNSNEFYVYGSNGAISGAFSPSASAGSLNFGKDRSGTLYNNTYTTSGVITNTPSIRIFAGTLVANNSITGVSSGITVDANSTLTINNTLSGGNTFTNNGTVNFNNASTNVSGFSSLANNATLNVNANSTCTVPITNASSMTIGGNLNMGANALTTSSNGRVTVSGNRTLTASSYTNSGTHVSTVTSSVVFDKLTCVGCAVTLNVLDLSGSTITPSSTTDITILTATNITGPNSTTFPGSAGFFQNYTVELQNANTELHLLVERIPYEDLSSPGVNTKIATVLDGIANGNKNSEQNALLNAINNINNKNDFNIALQNLLPNINTTIPNLVIQNEAINKVELRVASLRDEYLFANSGLNTGDLIPDRSFWMSGFGSLANQSAIDNDPGFKAKTSGMLMGLDGNFGANVFGVATGYSDSRITEFANQNHRTHINRFHGMVYGTHNMPYCNFFDWLITGSVNSNHSNRPSTIGGTAFYTLGKFNSYNAAVKLTRGKSFDFWDSYRFTPSTYVQYNYLNQNAYTETGAPSRLHIAEQVKSIVTLGLGARLNSPLDAWQMIGMRELRAIVAYDVLNNKDVMVANFAAGSDTFSVVNTPARLSLKLGAGMTFSMSKYFHMQLNYDYEIKRRYTDHTGMIKFRYLF